MKKFAKISLFLLFTFWLMGTSSCLLMTQDTIVGKWKVTKIVTVSVSDGDIFDFKSDGTYTRSDGTSVYYTGTYTISSGDLNLSEPSFGNYRAFVSFDEMIWYTSIIEAYRFKKQ